MQTSLRKSEKLYIDLGES